MAISLHGNIKEFNSTVENITDYIDRIQFYFEANSVTEDTKKRAVLLTVIGPQQFRLLKDLCAPAKPGTKTFEELSQLLKNHHEPAPPKFTCRAKFDARTRLPGETMSQYVAALRNLSEYCEFGETLNDRLCEKFVTGLNNQEIQRKLLLEKNLTLQKAVQLATSMQQTSDAVKSLAPPSVNVVQSVKKSSKLSGKQKPKCYRCNGPHSPQQCKFKSASCFKCSKVGHIAKACLTKSRSYHPPQQSRHHQQHYVESSQPDRSPNFDLFTLQSRSTQPPISVPVSVNNQTVEFQLDTGAALSVITEQDYKKFAISDKIQKCNKNLRTYTGQPVPVVGESYVNVQYGNQCRELPIIIVSGEGPPLLGRNWLEHIKLDWQDIFVFNNSDKMDRGKTVCNLKLEQTISENSAAFGSNGLLKGRTVKICVKDTNPKYCKARVPPYSLREKIEQELDRLQVNGIITKVEHSDWATPIVPVLKKDGSVRICGDYKITVNKEIEQNRHPIPNIEDIAFKLANGQKYTEIDFSHAYTQLGLHPDSKRFTTINTHKGLFQYERLCFGICSSPGIFQSVMDSIFQ